MSTVEAYDPDLDTSVAINESGPVAPSEFVLSQNYPNPFNPTTTIEYKVANTGRVSLIVYDMLGRHIRTLVDGREQAGRMQTSWDGLDERGSPVAGGLYFCRMQAEEYSAVIKMVLVR